MELAGEGWRAVYVAQALHYMGSLNTPKSSNLNPIYEKLTGVAQVSSYWTTGATSIDDFVTTRGNIAHNGRHAPYIGAATLQGYIEMIESAAAEHDNEFCDYLKATSGSPYQPWRRTA
jgi:hypothetical protein